MDKKKTVWIVVYDSGVGYGCEIYLKGIFTERDKATKAKDELLGYGIFINDIIVKEIPLDSSIRAVEAEWGRIGTDIYLGGYVE